MDICTFFTLKIPQFLKYLSSCSTKSQIILMKQYKWRLSSDDRWFVFSFLGVYIISRCKQIHTRLQIFWSEFSQTFIELSGFKVQLAPPHRNIRMAMLTPKLSMILLAIFYIELYRILSLFTFIPDLLCVILFVKVSLLFSSLLKHTAISVVEIIHNSSPKLTLAIFWWNSFQKLMISF